MDIIDVIFVIVFIGIGIAIEEIRSHINKAKKELLEELEAINNNLTILRDKFSILEKWLEDLTKEE
jgi:prefoldin subunit 5